MDDRPVRVGFVVGVGVVLKITVSKIFLSVLICSVCSFCITNYFLIYLIANNSDESFFLHRTIL